MPNALEFRSAYALVGFSGPQEIMKDVNWIREELSEPSKGPSVISIQLTTGKPRITLILQERKHLHLHSNTLV